MDSNVSYVVRSVAVAALILLAMRADAGSQFTSATASSGSGFMGPQAAIDGDLKTRWSSDANDKEFLITDLGSEQALVGVRYLWELARARDYDVDLSSDGKTWTTAYSVRDGDGSTDELYFGPRKARYVRMTGLRRGTGWGYSIYEVQVLPATEQRRLTASSIEANFAPQFACDGTTETAWRSDATTAPTEAWLNIQLPKPTAFGGVRVAWGPDGPRPWRLEAINGDPASTSARTILQGKGRGSLVEDVWCERTTATTLRLVVALDAGQHASVAEFSLKGPDETWNPVRHLESIAKTLPPGSLPRWLSREQVYWTITGLPRAPEDSLLDEDGRVEPLTKSFSVTPLLLLDRKLMTVHDFTTTQSLAEGWAPLPCVTWTGHEMRVQFRALTQEPGYTAVLCDVTNTGAASHDASLMITIRPALINPPWQHGGFAPLKNAEFTSGGATLWINDAPAVYVSPAPSATAIAQREGPDILERIQNAQSGPQKAADPDGLASPGLRFDLGAIAPNETRSILMIYPLKSGVALKLPADIVKFFEAQQTDLLARWHNWTGDWDLRLPDARLANIIRSNLAYLLINADGPAIQPGSRSYEHSWIRDGAISADALLRFGVISPVADYVKWFTPLVHDDGFVPFIVVAMTGKMPEWTSDWAEYDSFGEFAYIVKRYVDISGDKQFAATAFPKVKAALGMVGRLRDKDLAPEFLGTEFEGILPKSNSHEGYFPPQHSYWDDFWALRGLQDGAELAKLLGHADDANSFHQLETDLRKSILTTMQRCMEKKKINFLPAAADLGDLDPASTSINLMIADERDNLPHGALLAVYDRYTSETHHRRYVKNSIYTPYEFRNVQALLRLGQKAEADWLLDYLISDGVRPPTWNHVAEVVHPDPRSPNYLGDMPHGWCGASLVHAVTDCLFYEERGRVVLAAGVPDAWMDEGIEVRNLRTQWGPISYTLKREKGHATLTLTADQKPPNGWSVPVGVELKLRNGD